MAPLDMGSSSIPHAKEGDEISLSVEETNKLRESLGLPPLEVDMEGTKVIEDGVVFIDLEKQAREAAIRAKIEKAREERERLSLQHLEGKGLGDLLSEEKKDLNVEEWVLAAYGFLTISWHQARRSKKKLC